MIILMGSIMLAWVMCGGAWLMLRSIRFAVRSKITESRMKKECGAGRGSEKNRLRVAGATMRSDYNSGQPEDHPHPHDHTEMMRGPYPLPLTTKMLDDHDQAIKHLEKEQNKVVTQLEKSVNNTTKLLSLMEKMTMRLLAQDKEITILKDKLADSIFILYGGKKPDGK